MFENILLFQKGSLRTNHILNMAAIYDPSLPVEFKAESTRSDDSAGISGELPASIGDLDNLGEYNPCYGVLVLKSLCSLLTYSVALLLSSV